MLQFANSKVDISIIRVTTRICSSCEKGGVDFATDGNALERLLEISSL